MGRWKKKSEIKISDKVGSSYFFRVSFFHYLCVILGFMLFGFVCFNTDAKLLKRFGGPGERLLYLRENFLTQLRIGFFFAIFLHVIEALYVIKVCGDLKMSQDAVQKWVVQTFICGYSSLRHLLEFRDIQNSKKVK